MIRTFSNSDIITASQISYDFWANSFEQSKKVKQIIYEFLVKFYFTNPNYSFCFSDECVNAFILSGFICDEGCIDEELKNKIKNLSPKDKIQFDELKEYLLYNKELLKEYVSQNDLIINLFISRKKGCGKILLEHLIKQCKEKNIENIYLWTDKTCNYKYYSNFGFEEIIINKAEDQNSILFKLAL